ncbi:MAG: hypothetical protein R3E42_12485 [Burkholderiaceae bacterium]
MDKQDFSAHTPMMQQYLAIKAGYPDTLVSLPHGRLLRGLSTTLKKPRACSTSPSPSAASRRVDPGVMYGVPFHALDNYLARLIKLGESAAICEQVGDVATSKGPVERKVVRVDTGHPDRHRTVGRCDRSPPDGGAPGRSHRLRSGLDVGHTRHRGFWRNAPATNSPIRWRGSGPAKCSTAQKPARPSERPQGLVALPAAGGSRTVAVLRPAWAFDSGLGERKLLEQLQTAAWPPGMPRPWPTPTPPPPPCSNTPNTPRAGRSPTSRLRVARSDELIDLAAQHPPQPGAHPNPARRNQPHPFLPGSTPATPAWAAASCANGCWSRGATGADARQRLDAIATLREGLGQRLRQALKGASDVERDHRKAPPCARSNLENWSDWGPRWRGRQTFLRPASPASPMTRRPACCSSLLKTCRPRGLRIPARPRAAARAVGAGPRRRRDRRRFRQRPR